MIPLSYWIPKGRALSSDLSVTGALVTSSILFNTASKARSVIGLACKYRQTHLFEKSLYILSAIVKSRAVNAQRSNFRRTRHQAHKCPGWFLCFFGCELSCASPQVSQTCNRFI